MDKHDLKIAIADDHVDTVTSISNYLEGNGIKTVWAYTADDAINLCKKEHPDLLVINFKMEDLTAPEIAHQLSFQKIVFMISRDFNKELPKSENILGTIYKPIDPYALLEAILKMFKAN